MSTASEYFKSIGEPYAAAFFEDEDCSKFYRFSKAFAAYFRNRALPEYTGGRLYPSGFAFLDDYAVKPDFSRTYSVNFGELEKKCASEYVKRVREELAINCIPPSPHWVGGAGFCHSFPNYERIEREGFDSYRARIEAIEDGDFKDGLLCLLDGIAAYHGRCLEKLRASDAREDLIAALEQVPFKPARTLYEAIVCRNFVYYLDLCDEPGRLDQELIRWYKGEDITEILEEFFASIDVNNSWSAAIGPDYNELTVQILKTIKGKRRPSVELRVTPDMPDELWELAADAIKAGGGSPALYNEPLYQQRLAEEFPDMPAEDRIRFNGGGCTETMLAGISRVGSLDAGLNAALVLRDAITKYLPSAETYEAFYAGLCAEMNAAADRVVSDLETLYTKRIKEQPQPMRTLLIDDCIDKQTEFNSGGARYSWGIINIAGSINVVDSLLAIRKLVYEQKAYAPAEFVRLLDAEDPALYAKFKKCPHYGVDDAEANALAEKVGTMLFSLFDGKKPVVGDRFLTSSIQFQTYADAGRPVGPTPDGRKNGEPLCDSLSAIHGNDVLGPTAMLNSAACLKPAKALGTPVLNLTLSPQHVKATLRPLVEGYFAQGGMQVQVTSVSRADLLDAMEHPERHANLIVRVGGYAEYFNRLSEDLQRAVIARTDRLQA